MATEITYEPVSLSRIGVRKNVRPTAIVRWLAAGWSDFVRAPYPSLAIGLACACFGLALVLVTWGLQLPVLTLPLTTGFVFIAPLPAIGLYESSRRQARGETVPFGCTLAALRRNPTGILDIGALLSVFLLAWVMIAWLMLTLFAFVATFAAPASFPFAEEGLVLLRENWDICVLGFGLGAVLAAIGFCLSVVSLPMLVSENVDALEAAAASWRACRANPVTMAFWAATLLLCSLLAAAPAFLLLIVAVPVLGHASWHAYRDLTEVGPG